MKKFLPALSTAVLLFAAPHANAQIFNRIKSAVSSKVENTVDKVLEGKSKTTEQVGSASRKAERSSSDIFANADKNFHFKTATTIIFEDDFSKDPSGRMALNWKTSGSGSVSSLPDHSGNWLLLKEFTSYKLKSNTPLPDNFTLEFDIATSSNTGAKDLQELKFGFAHDNAINAYISDAYNDNAITSTSVHYWNKEITNSSSDTKIYNTIEFPLAQYAVGTMHVSIEVKGKMMAVYLDKVKVLDTEMFLHDSEKKYFYISTGTELSNDAKIGISNFKLASF
ncbi:hypothetical protein [Chryseobacterium sp. A301]